MNLIDAPFFNAALQLISLQCCDAYLWRLFEAFQRGVVSECFRKRHFLHLSKLTVAASLRPEHLRLSSHLVAAGCGQRGSLKEA